MRGRVSVALLMALSGVASAQSPSNDGAPALPATQPVAVPLETAAPTARQAQADAAKADAVGRLLADVSQIGLTERLTIGDLLARTETSAAMRAAIARADQIGGVRWLDGQTAQVQLEMGGDEIAAEVRAILRTHGSALKLASTDVEPALTALAKRSLVATGSSTTAATLTNVAAGQDAWVGVDEGARAAAIAAAKRQAVDSVLDSVRSVRLSDGRTMGDLLGESGSVVRTQLEEHLASRPVTSVKFHDNREVEVTLSAPPVETFRVIRNALTESKAVALGDDEWSRIRDEFLDEISAATGRGAIPELANLALPVQPQVALPEQAPVWVDDMLDAQGSAVATETKLKTARAAEQQALADLRAQVLDLPLTPQLKIGQAADKDPEIAAAVDRAIARARTYKSDYFADGRVVVRTSLDLRDVWQQLHQRQP